MDQPSPERLQDLAESFRRSLADGGSVAASHLAVALGEALDRCRRTWPNLSVDLDGFVRHLASKADASSPELLLHSEHLGDLFLAYACASGDPSALASFSAAYDRDVEIACARARAGPTFGELRQQLYHKLFVAQPPAPPRILDYSGQGKLQGWFRVTVGRAILDHHRAQARDATPLDEGKILSVPAPGNDPEAEYLKRRYRHEFRESFEEAVAALAPEERNVLRSYYAKQMGIDEIASMFGIHRATAARRVQRARENLMSETRRALTSRLKVSGTELESVLRLIESQLHVSVERLLG